ncbi:MAG: hypothetical protein KJ624_07590, partial [Chloroflexi bacterium]|nr:hypothetical protein [Chloroflexota bacterium]
AQKHLSLAPIRVGLALFQAGTRTVDAGGNPIIRGQVSLSQLQKLTRLSRQAVLDGLEDLEELAGLVRHPGLRTGVPSGYALPLVRKVDQPQIPPGQDSRPPIVVGGGPDIDKSTTTTPVQNVDHPDDPPSGPDAAPSEPNQELLDKLAELGSGDPQQFLEFPLERVSAWVEWALAQPQGRLRNPAGYIFRKLEEGKDPPAEPNLVARMTRGKYGHVYRH